MSKLFIVYIQNSMQLSVIAVLMLAFSSLIARRYSAKCRYYLWGIIFVALVLPIRAKITLALPEIFSPILPHSTDTAPFSTVIISDNIKAENWLQFASVIWGIGAFCFLGWHIFQHLSFLFGIRRWSGEVEASDILKQFSYIKDKMGIRDYISVKSCACIKTPMVIGMFRPMVLLPQVDFSQEELPLILKHEFVHYKRKDIWYKTLMMIALAFHWFNPVVHLMVKSVLDLCEISCDEEVLKGINAKGRAQYGEAIIGLVRNGGSYHTALSTNFYSGTKGMKNRIYAMMDMTNKRFSPVLFMTVIIITACATTAFALGPVKGQNSGQGANKTIENFIKKEEPAIKEKDEKSSISSYKEKKDNMLIDSEVDNRVENLNDIEPRIITDDKTFPVESSKEQIRDTDIPRIVADNDQ